MRFVENVSRDLFGSIVIRSIMRTPPGRKGYEKMFWPGIELGLLGWERAHSQGNITGSESEHAIRYAPRVVNQHFQRLGIERFVKELFEEKAEDVDLWLTTVTATHPRTLRLKEIQYRVDAVRSDKSAALFEASIEVENKTELPRVTISAQPRLERQDWLRFVR